MKNIPSPKAKTASDRPVSRLNAFLAKPILARSRKASTYISSRNGTRRQMALSMTPSRGVRVAREFMIDVSDMCFAPDAAQAVPHAPLFGGRLVSPPPAQGLGLPPPTPAPAPQSARVGGKQPGRRVAGEAREDKKMGGDAGHLSVPAGRHTFPHGLGS